MNYETNKFEKFTLDTLDWLLFLQIVTLSGMVLLSTMLVTLLLGIYSLNKLGV